MHAKIKSDVETHDVVLFMKGTPGDSPCGYSSRMVQILDHFEIEYTVRDVLAADELRSAIKTYSGVKTLPQLFVGGSFAGGTDDIREMYENRTLQTFFNGRGVAANADAQNTDLDIQEVSRDEKIACAKN